MASLAHLYRSIQTCSGSPPRPRLKLSPAAPFPILKTRPNARSSLCLFPVVAVAIRPGSVVAPAPGAEVGPRRAAGCKDAPGAADYNSAVVPAVDFVVAAALAQAARK